MKKLPEKSELSIHLSCYQLLPYLWAVSKEKGVVIETTVYGLNTPRYAKKTTFSVVKSHVFIEVAGSVFYKEESKFYFLGR